MTFGRNALWTMVLGVAAAGIFLAECALFHFPFATGLDVLWLVWFIFVIGAIVVLSLRQFFSLELSAHEILSLSCALGFGVFPTLLTLRHVFGFDHLQPPSPAIIDGVFAALIAILVTSLRRAPREEHERLFIGIKEVCIFTIGALLLFAAYNLQQFHYGGDGSIITRGLFGVDIPFLAGEVHGIRDFGILRDLHQMAQPWQYHDWTYQLLALLPRDRTLSDLALAAPLVGYTMLALSISALTFRLTSNKYLSYLSVALWFLISGLGAGELSSYALSPSFVFGSMIVVNIVLALDLRLKAKDPKKQWVFSAILLVLLIELSQTKLSSFLVIMCGMGILGLLILRRQRRNGVALLSICVCSLLIVLWQTGRPNPLMPGSDFLIGAPLLGYANHLAAILHVPVSTLNPVTHGLSFRWQSLLVVPLFLFHFFRFAIVDPKILSAIIAIIVLRKSIWGDSQPVIALLVAIIPLGFLLPVLYSPSWYPLALSFYAPLVSVQAAMLLTIFGFSRLSNDVAFGSPRIAKAAFGIISIFLLIGAAQAVHRVIQDDDSMPGTVNKSLVHAMEYLRSHSSDTDIVITHRHDLSAAGDESFYWYSALSGRTIVSEGAKYGALLGAVADVDSEKGLHRAMPAERMLLSRRTLLDTIYTSLDSINFFTATEQTHASYLLETGSPGEHLSFEASHVASRVFVDGDMVIWRLNNSQFPLNFLNK